MNHIITCNPLGKIRSLKDDNGNFIVCHMYEETANYLVSREPKINYNIYCNDECMDEYADLEEEYTDINFNVIEVSYMSQISTNISDFIERDYKLYLEDEDKYEYPNIIVAGEESFSRLMTNAINRTLRDDGIDVQAMNLMQYYGMTDVNKLAEMIKREFNTKFIYPEDPVFFGYVVNRLLRKR